MSGGGGEPNYDVDEMNDAMATIRPPKAVYDPDLPSFAQGGINSEAESQALDTHYRNATFKLSKDMQGPTPQEQMAEAMRIIARESATGRIPDPDYDLTGRDAAAYRNIDHSALALQRARDYADDLEATLRAKGEAYSKAERERIIANRQAEELTRLESSKGKTDAERAAGRDERRQRLLAGKSKLRPGQSLLTGDDETSGLGSLLTG